MSFETLLINTCNIWRWAGAGEDDYGQPVKSWNEHYLENEPCRLSASSGREIKIGNDIYVYYDTLFVGDIDIVAKDKVFVNSQEYDILAVLDRQDGNSGHHKECLLLAVKQ